MLQATRHFVIISNNMLIIRKMNWFVKQHENFYKHQKCKKIILNENVLRTGRDIALSRLDKLPTTNKN